MPVLPRGLILGHRGAPAELPENTLGSFRRALEQGAEGVELDVQPSADGVPVVIHDDTLDRTTDGRGAVAALPWSALRRLRIRDIRPRRAGRGTPGGDGGGAVERIPSLAEVAAWAAASGAWLNVELKAAGAEAASLETLRSAGVLARTFLSSFDPAVVATVGRLDPDVPRFFLTERWDAPAREAARHCGAHGICLEGQAATPTALQELAEAGLPVVVWTVDDPARVEALLRAGVVAVITNLPARAVAVRQALPRI